jgi:hypothetical protein
MKHALTNVDADRRRGDCAACGPNVVIAPRTIAIGRVWRCKQVRKGVKRNRQKASANQLKSRLSRFYGLTLDRFWAMAARQGNRCAICRELPIGYARLSVDHCHTTGKVRGLLCTNCNAAIGMFREDPGRLRAAIRYLEKHNAVPGPKQGRAQPVEGQLFIEIN